MRAAASRTSTPRYRWTPLRIAGGVMIVLAGAAVVAAMVWREFGPRELRWGMHVRELPEDVMPLVRDRTERALASFNLDDLRLPRDAILSGGPRKDGIPSLTEPNCVPVAEADFLRPGDRVIGVTIAGEARAYPIHVLMWHEAINDVLGTTPIAIIYCPLCDSASVVDRRLDDRVYEFGISGLLYNSNVLLYDRTDDALWSQIGLTAVSGPNAGRFLTHLPWELTTFGPWAKAHPDSTVVSFETGHARNYGRSPYGEYFDVDTLMFPVAPLDRRLPVKERVVGVRVDGTYKAYPVKVISTSPGGRVRDDVAGQPVELEADRRAGRVRVVRAGEGMQVVHTFWFAWAAIHPETTVYDP